MKKNLPILTAALLAAGLVYSLFPAGRPSPVERFGRLPVLNGGRVKPVDSLARNSLLLLSGKQTLRVAGRPVPATQWFLDTLFRPEVADGYAVFEINDPDVLGLLGIQQGPQRRYAFKDLAPHLEAIETQAHHAEGIRSEDRSRFQTAVGALQGKLILYQKIQNTLQISSVADWQGELAAFEGALAERNAPATRAKKKSDPHGGPAMLASFRDRYAFLSQAAEFLPLPVPGPDPVHWVSVGATLLVRFEAPALHPGVPAYARMGDAYRAGDTAAFGEAVDDYRAWLMENVPSPTRRVGSEVLFNRFAPFYKALLLYGLVALLIFISFLAWPEPLRKTASHVLWIAFLVHTFGLVSRIVLQGRPPVTNLYSSAVFVGWVAVLLGIVLERLYKNGLGALGAAGIGFLTQIIAHHLATQGDTMEMMRAVLDSNFWLATHVVTVTIGYSSTFLSGFLAMFYILRGLFSSKLTPEAGRTLARMVYGIVCFSAFFSFVGTVLGGIWADQSWGRFWGWDPKENGALLIVLWNALILHLRWGGFIRQRGLMVAAVFGNIVTALSWFGVNMLGIGLHSYGFMDKAFPWLAAFVGSQVLVMILGLLPDRFWGSRPWPTEPAALS